jgi:hypothetical protein
MSRYRPVQRFLRRPGVLDARSGLEDERDEHDDQQDYQNRSNAYVHLILLLESR